MRYIYVPILECAIVSLLVIAAMLSDVGWNTYGHLLTGERVVDRAWSEGQCLKVIGGLHER